ncbi:MAG: hypothetical protein ACXAC5_18845 [Promethearchaeota archaeon]|jgi:hypothetical protein
MIVEDSCKYCGWKFPSEYIDSQENKNLLLCENCGTEIFSECNENDDLAKYIEEKIKNKELLSRIDDIVQEKKNPIARVLVDSDFPIIFKDNLKIVISRLLYPHIGTLESEPILNKENREITKEILDDLYEMISPIMNLRINDIFLTNLHELSIKEFLKWLKVLQDKIRLNHGFQKDFTIYLRWMIREVYTIITELWNKRELPKFERVIRDDLKSFESCLSSYEKFLDTSTGIELNQRVKVRYRNPPRHINLNAYIKPVIEKFLKSVKSRQKQLKLDVSQPYITLNTKKMIDVYINRGLYDYVGTVYRIIEKSTGKMLYGFTLDSLNVRWQNYKKFALKNRNLRNLLPVEQAILDAIDSGQNPDKVFIVKPVEICFDYNTLRIREDYWINKHDTKNPVKGFNSYRGGGGGPKINLPIGIIASYIAKGLKATKIARLFFTEQNILVGRKTVSRRIDEYWGGFNEARARFLKPVLEKLIKTGFNSNDIIEAFGKKGRNIADRLIPSFFNVDSFGEARRKCLLENIESLIIEGLGPAGMAKRLKYFGEKEIASRITEEWGSLKEAQKTLWRPIIIQSFKDGMSGPDILVSLGYKESTAKRKHNQIFTRLFWGMSTEDVREFALSFPLHLLETLVYFKI